MSYVHWDREELTQEWKRVQADYDAWKGQGLTLNMARGKPGLEQLALSRELFTILDFDHCVEDGIDARNYGELAGMPCARRYWAQMLDVEPEQCFVGGSSSLTMMYDLVAKAWSNGLFHSPKPWSQLERVKFLCPCPGYDRHFRITQSFGIELIPISMTEEGPDMDSRLLIPMSKASGACRNTPIRMALSIPSKPLPGWQHSGLRLRILW